MFVVAIIYIGIPAKYMTRVLPEGLSTFHWTLLFSALYVPLSW